MTKPPTCNITLPDTTTLPEAQSTVAGLKIEGLASLTVSHQSLAAPTITIVPTAKGFTITVNPGAGQPTVTVGPGKVNVTKRKVPMVLTVE